MFGTLPISGLASIRLHTHTESDADDAETDADADADADADWVLDAVADSGAKR